MAVLRREEIERRVAEMAAGICIGLGLNFVDCRYRKRDGEWVLLVRIDRETGVSIDDCTSVNRLLSERLDEADPIEHGYTLEVSSLGLSEPLKTDEDFARFVGRPVEALVSPGRGGPGRKADDGTVVGRLLGFDGASLTLEPEVGVPVRLDRSRVHRVRPAVNFEGTGERER